MTGSWWWDLMIGGTGAVLLTWLALVVVLIIVRPRGGLLTEAREGHVRGRNDQHSATWA